MDPLFWETLRHRRLASRNCLNHSKVLIDLEYRARKADIAMPYVAAMGEARNPKGTFAHCWLETNPLLIEHQIVVDLTLSTRMHEQLAYYAKQGIDHEQVRRFDAVAVGRKMISGDGLIFWND